MHLNPTYEVVHRSVICYQTIINNHRDTDLSNSPKIDSSAVRLFLGVRLCTIWREGEGIRGEAEESKKGWRKADEGVKERERERSEEEDRESISNRIQSKKPPKRLPCSRLL